MMFCYYLPIYIIPKMLRESYTTTSVYEHFSAFGRLAGEVDKNRNLNFLM